MPLELAARARVPRGVLGGTIGVVMGRPDRIQMARDQGVHADIRTDHTGFDVNGLCRNHPGLLALPHEAREDLAEDVCAPALPDARQRGVIRQSLVQGVTDEPADHETDLRFTHQSPVLNDPQQEARQHQPNGNLGIDAGTAVVGTIEIGQFGTEPPKIKNLIDPHQHMVISEHNIDLVHIIF